MLTQIAGRARARRWEMLLDAFPRLDEMTVVDLGGEPAAWRTAPVLPAELTIVNFGWINRAAHQGPGRLVDGDACDPRLLEGERFDVAYSNSVIEHVGGYQRRRKFAKTVRRLADACWIQTPYRYFPIEQHAMFPCLQFLPLAARAKIVKRWPLGNMRTGNPADTACWIDLLAGTELRLLFPEAQILHERVAGLTKSLIAYEL